MLPANSIIFQDIMAFPSLSPFLPQPRQIAVCASQGGAYKMDLIATLTLQIAHMFQRRCICLFTER